MFSILKKLFGTRNDRILKQLRRIEVPGGIAHAFNGSRQQAQMFIDLGFRLGFGGAMSFEGSTRIRELARSLPLDAIVLEAGGRLYPAKDARMPRALFEAGYPRIAEFLPFRDPKLGSAMSRRLLGD